MTRYNRLVVSGGLAIALLIVGFLLFRSFLLPFVVGLAAAYLLDPLADRLQRVNSSRTLAALVITIGFFGAVLGAAALLVPYVAYQIVDLVERLPTIVDTARDRLQPIVNRLLAIGPLRDILQSEGLMPQLGQRAMAVVQTTFSSVLQSGVAAINLLSLLFVTPIVTFYLLRDWDLFVRKLRELLPPDVLPTANGLASEVDEVLAGYFRGQALVCLFLAVFYGVGLWLVGLQYGLAIGFLTGFFSFVPYVGMLVGAVVGLLVAAFQFQNVLMIAVVAAIFALGQFIEGNFVTPRLVGSRIHLHPVWVIFAVFAGAVLFGVVGALFAVPAAGVLAVFVRFAVWRWRTSSLYGGYGGASKGR